MKILTNTHCIVEEVSSSKTEVEFDDNSLKTQRENHNLQREILKNSAGTNSNNEHINGYAKDSSRNWHTKQH